jgi:hypothetical protein
MLQPTIYIPTCLTKRLDVAAAASYAAVVFGAKEPAGAEYCAWNIPGVTP